jgi:hypothetical protein
MAAVKGRVQECYWRFGAPGMAQVKVTIDPRGQIAAAQARGKFAGTPTGKCVAEEVRRATFPAFKGAPITIEYAYILRDHTP